METQQNITNLPEQILVPFDVVVHLKESLAEIKADVKDIRHTLRLTEKEIIERFDLIKQKQDDQRMELERQKWKHGIMATIGTVLGGAAMKLSGLFS